MEFLVVLGLVFGIFILLFVLINICYIFMGNEFRGICVINNFMFKLEIGECMVCGKKLEEECKMLEIKLV